MTFLATAKRQVGDVWQSLGFALAYPWFKLIEQYASTTEYRGAGEFVSIKRGRYSDYKRGEIAATLGLLPAIGYLATAVCLYAFDIPLITIPVTLCVLPSVAVVSEVSVRTLGGDGR